MSLGYAGTKQPYQTYWIKVSPVQQRSAEDLTFFTSPNNMFSDGKQMVTSNNGTANLLALDLPPGEYQIDSVGAFSDTGPYSWGGLKRPPMVQTKFVIGVGEVSYLGSALLRRQPDNSLVYVVFDEMDRDIKLLRSIRPDLGTLPTTRVLLNSETFRKP